MISSFYYQFLERFGIADQLTAVIILVYAGATLLSLILRVIACVGYQTQYAIFRLYGKEIKVKADAANIKNGLVGRTAADYIKSYDKGAANISAAAVVKKNTAGMGFLFWKFDSMSGFIKGYENSVVLIGLLLTVFLDHPAFFGVQAIASFLFLRVFASFFDYELARERLTDELIIYLEREIGQFYAPDLSSGINRLRIEMTEAAASQAEAFEKNVQRLSEELKNAMRLSIDELALDRSVAEWRKTLNESSVFQNGFNKNAETLERAAVALNSSISEYSGGVKEFADKLKGGFEAQEFVEKNQALLNESFNKFELSLQDITGKFGNSLASIVDHRVRASYDALNEAVTDNIKQILGSNNELVARLQKLFESFQERSAAETQAILRIKEQMEIYNDRRN